MAKFKVKSEIVIDATQFWPGMHINSETGEVMLRGLEYDDDDRLVCHTLEGPLFVTAGDWIVTGLKGERYPVKPDIFEAKYEPLPEKEG